ncbi:group III truncated hemoglobin [Roseomonas sp. SSH11]|uniref:Group III truncated hemoglobin n=1 Tax=Pararoseomonas baculiformis TaxID=2820812 RepID=A0ABS4AKF9_9PROT|nr:group III truncated hemoglobin [Pararoseomonas baculiformis]MBP0447513.1 group III truncated hemoglobin [Pararoseomonas baculiformis]
MSSTRLLDGAITEDGIRRLLDRFYGQVRRDPQLGPVFARAVGTNEADWAAHLVRLADFWSSVMLRSGRYHGDPFSAHLRLPDLEPAMFDRWLLLFNEACVELFTPDVAGAFRERAMRIAASLRMGLERLPMGALPRRRDAAPPPAAGVTGT